MSDGRPWRAPLALYAILALVIFVFLHGFMPSDPRIKMGFKTFEADLSITAENLWFAVKKWRHILWFAIFFPVVRSLFKKNATRNAVIAVFAISVAIELEQTVIAGRNCRLVDLIPNLMGTGLGAWVWSKWLARSKSRSTSAP